MKFSTKGRYGLRAMVDLAVHSSGEQVSLNSIAERQHVSENYLEQVFSMLKKAGLVNSIKGAQGGYILAHSPSNITVGDVLRILEGELSIVDSSQSTDNQVEAMDKVLAGCVWDKITEGIHLVVDSLTLEDLVYEYKKMNSELSNMFYI